MQEARKINGIQNYPFIFIKESEIKSKSRDIFDGDGNIIPVVSTCINRDHTPMVEPDKIVTIERLKDGTYHPFVGIKIFDETQRAEVVAMQGGSIGATSYTGKSIASRESEYIVFIYYFTSPKRITVYNTTGPTANVGFGLITNYGNIISGHDMEISSIYAFSEIIIKNNNNNVWDISFFSQWSSKPRLGTFSIEFINADLPPKECYVPQVFVDVITIFLKHTQLVSNQFKEKRELVQKFKEICYKFTHGGYNDKSKDEEIERLKFALQERDKEIQSLKDCNKMVSNLNKVVDENEDEIDQLQQALEESRKNLKEISDRLAYRVVANQKLERKKAECTRIYRDCNNKVTELEDEIANLKSILKVYNIPN